MADKQISQLVAATTINNDDLFVMQQGGTAKKLSGQKLSDFVYQSAADQIERVNEAVEQTQAAVDALEEQKNEIAQTIADMAELGTDTTLTTPAMAADAAATGEVKDVALARFEQSEVTGVPIATFEDGADNVPVKKLVVGIDPVQDLHGYSNPWPAGGGSQLLDVQDAAETSDHGATFKIVNGTIKCSGLIDAGVNFPIIPIASAFTVPAGTYTYSLTGTATNCAIQLRRASGSPAVVDFINTTNPTRTVTFENEETLYVNLNSGTAGVNINANAKIKLEKGSSATAWTPYSNVCPITGWTEANVSARGNNLLNYATEIVEKRLDNKGVLINFTNGATSDFIPVKPSISIYGRMLLNGGSGYAICEYDKNKQFIRYQTAATGTGYSSKAYTLTANTYFIRCTYAKDHLNDPAILYPSSQTDYVPYTGTTYPITFPSEAGTVYGGTLDVTNGVLTVDRIIQTEFTIYESGTNSASGINYASSTLEADATGTGQDSIIISNQYTQIAAGSTPTASGQIKKYASGITFYNTAFAGMSYAEIKAFLESDRVQVLYYRTTPITYTLTPTAVRTLLAINNIWADSGNINDLIYRKMPIPVDELENTLESMIAGVEVTMEATQNYTAGNLVAAAHKLYHISFNIASGETLIPGTNCYVTTIADELAILASDIYTQLSFLGNVSTLTYQVVT